MDNLTIRKLFLEQQAIPDTSHWVEIVYSLNDNQFLELLSLCTNGDYLVYIDYISFSVLHKNLETTHHVYTYPC